ncbi:MAG: glycoside hydrolase family 3 C-terminal domain-containing protein [Clostridium sp.]|nr:glycoside hydrolase family 3 C-terminal domain-containing protein [Clostridium sp.]
MNKLTACMITAIATVTAASAAVPAIPADPEIEVRVEETLSKMSIDEKVGQMLQLSIDLSGEWKDGKFVLDRDRIAEVISKYKVGSFLNIPGSVAITPEEWVDVISFIQDLSLKENGIPTLYGLDQNHGTTYTRGGILFPQNINVGASFNPELAREASAITAYETRAADCPWTFCPTVDLTRDPRWSRDWENFGEDPLVNAVMGASQVRGFQGDDPNNVTGAKIGATIKHYLGYGAPRTGKDRTPAYISPSDLREKFFEPYRACLEAGALSVMVNSGSINGRPVHANRELLTGWLKDELGWDGMIVSDWADIINLHTREHIAADKKEAIEIAINAGIDMSMDPYDTDFCVLLKELVEEGRVPQARIDDAVRRILRMKYRLGLFDTPNTRPADYPDFASKAHEAVAIRAAEESEVLLKNRGGILPIKKGTRILVTGPNANSMRPLNGGWSYTWQGEKTDRYADRYNTIYEAVAEKFGPENVILEQGVTYVPEGRYDEENAPEIEKAVAAAAGADLILACIGENSYCETPGNLDDLRISQNQAELVRRLSATGKPIVLILNEGRPRIIADIEPLADAVIDILLPGNFGADALANILSGDTNPSGRLPFTYPRHPAGLTTYDYRVSEETDRMEGAYDYEAAVSVQWPFGYGQSYTTFDYANLSCSKPQFSAGDELVFTVDVTNTGDVAGKEVVMLFSRDLVASLTPENRRLRAFQKIELAPGETRRVELPVKASDLAFVDLDGKWVLEKGDFRIQVGDQTMTVNCAEAHKWDTPNRN